jgi:multidrug efflux pump subunit AcrA (membrane-fusion protein)
VQPGSAIARLYATDTAEVRLPLTMDQLNYLAWPRHPGTEKNRLVGDDSRPRVSLTAQIAGTQQLWRGRIIRIDSAVDETTGLLHAVTEIHYPQNNHDNQHQLLPGLFVNAEIEGRRLENVFKLPREAVNANRQVLLINQNERIHLQPVSILRIETDHVLINGGLNANDLVALSAMTAFSDGLKVKSNLIESETAPQSDADFALPSVARP